MKLLIAEDEVNTAGLMAAYFSGRGHDPLLAVDGEQAIELFNRHRPDFVLLDINMPKKSGWDVLEEIRRANGTPVIIVTSLCDPEHAVKGLSNGADDYLRKPFDLQELGSRVDAIMRRVEANGGQQNRINVGLLAINDDHKEVAYGDTLLCLTPKEYSLLFLLAREPGRVYSNEEIIREVWGGESRATSADVKQYVHLLRCKLAKADVPKSFIETLKGFGYRISI